MIHGTPELAQLKRELEDLRNGRIAVVGTVSLATTPAVSTAVTRAICSATSVVILTPYDVGAATEVAGPILDTGSLYVVPANGSFTVHHSASAATRTFRYVIFTGNTY
jgi:hypothetical protein